VRAAGAALGAVRKATMQARAGLAPKALNERDRSARPLGQLVNSERPNCTRLSYARASVGTSGATTAAWATTAGQRCRSVRVSLPGYSTSTPTRRAPCHGAPIPQRPTVDATHAQRRARCLACAVNEWRAPSPACQPTSVAHHALSSSSESGQRHQCCTGTQLGTPVGITTGIKLRIPEGAQRPRASSASTSELNETAQTR
jgi:hypothetical protein